MKSKTLWMMLAFVTLSLLYLVITHQPAKPVASVAEDPSHVVNDKIQAKPTIVVENHDAIAQVVRHAAHELNNRAKIYQLQKELVALHSLSGTVNKHEYRREALKNLANDPDAILLAGRVFEDFDWVQREFQDAQAIVRIYSIQVLKMRAELGDRTPLERATQNLAKKLATDLSEWQRGRDHDLRDLVGAVIELDGRDVVLQNVKAFFVRVGYVPALKPIYGHAVTSYLYRSSMDDEVDRAFMPFWNETI